MKARILTLAALAALLPATAAASSIALSDYYKKLVKWQISTVPYHLNPAGSADISNQSDIQAVKESFNDWVSLPCSSLKVNHVGDAGNTSLLTGAQANGKNELHWVETAAWQYGKYVLGVTAPLYDNNGKIWESDIAFNGYLQSWSTTGGWGQTDVKAIAVHEIGHFFGIQHNLGGYSYSSPPTMAPSWDGTLKQRTLEQDDKNSFCFLYDNADYSCSSDADCPYVVGHKSNGEEYYTGKYACKSGKCQLGSTGGGTTGTKALGESCTTDNDCKSNLFCQQVWGMGSICSQLCTPSKPLACPTGFQCIPYENSSQGACVPGGPAQKKEGQACESSNECETGYCATNPTDGSLECRETCTVGTSGACVKGQVCVPSHGAASSVGGCWGAEDVGKIARADTEECDFDWQCKSERCVLDADDGGQYCRAACSPGHPSCAAGTWCVELTPAVGACIPGTPPPPPPKLEDGAICELDEDCESGACRKPPGGSRAICVTLCALGDDSCPAGQVCVGAGDPTWGLCMDAALPAGSPCAGAEDCSSELCLAGEGGSVCAQACEAGTACPCGTTCEVGASGAICVPDSEAPTCAGAGVACGSNLECESGYCDGGSCAGTAGGGGGSGAGDGGGSGSGSGSGSGGEGDAAGSGGEADTAGGGGGVDEPGGVDGNADLTGSTSGSGCAASGGPPGGTLAALLLLALAGLRRRPLR